MTCEDLDALSEPMAAGDIGAPAEARAHLESCPRCAGALALARRIETTLADWDAPAAPARFTEGVLARIRKDRWQAEQRVDRLFNVAIVTGVALVLAGVWMLMNLSGLSAVGAETGRLLADGLTGAADRVT